MVSFRLRNKNPEFASASGTAAGQAPWEVSMKLTSSIMFVLVLLIGPAFAQTVNVDYDQNYDYEAGFSSSSVRPRQWHFPTNGD